MTQTDVVVGTKPSIKDLERCIDLYADVPAEVVIKEDLLRQGLRFTEEALKAAKGCRRKSYYLFSYNMVSFDDLTQGEGYRAPEEIRLSGGPYELLLTVVRVELNNATPYLIDLVDGQLTLFGDGTMLGEVEYLKEPAAYQKQFEDGTTYGELVAVIGWGQRTLSTVYRHCNYFDSGQQCRFCDMNGNVKAVKETGYHLTIRKKPEQIAEVLRELFVEQPADEPRRRVMQLTGGAVIDPVRGVDKDEDFYLKYVKAIRDKVSSRWPLALQMVAKEKDTLLRFRDAGLDIYHANMEVWDENLFNIICPGKAQYVGRNEWIRRVVDAVDVFGEGNVFVNFVAGVEMSQPHGFDNVDDAVASTAEGFDYLMSHGVIPRFNHWVIEPTAALTGNKQPPLDYYVQICRAWYQLWKKNQGPAPRGYPMGPGRATHHVSALLDVGA